MKVPLPHVSWPEGADPAAERRTAGEVCALLVEGLPPLVTGHARLLFALPTPSPYDTAHTALVKGLPASLHVRSLTWPPHGRCYVAEVSKGCSGLVPPMFRLGPPELTLIAVQGPCGMEASEEALLKLMQSALADEACPELAAYTGLHFDSGDLRERF